MTGVLAAALIVIVIYSSPAAGQELRCVAIRQDETAAAVAKRVTGDARNRYESWFQILDPATSTFVRKARYDHIRTGWRACVNNEPGTPNNSRAVPTAWVSRLESTIATLDRNARAIDSNAILCLWLVVAIVLMSWSVTEYMTTRQQTLEAMQHFGEAFVREFERPLLARDEAGRPVRAQIRTNAQRRRLEVLLAPADGRRYPNLADHQKNLEYDVNRVLQHLGAPSTIGRPLYAQGQWVVVPFEFTDGFEQAGVK